MTKETLTQLRALSAWLRLRREPILSASRSAAEADPTLTTVSVLTRAQFNDHIPLLLDVFEVKLGQHPEEALAAAADPVAKPEETKHGLQRWQQGYKLAELVQEWGHLHVCLFAEIRTFSHNCPEVRIETLDTAHALLIDLINDGIRGSVTDYARLQQAEAAGHVQALRQALAKVSQIEQGRATLIRQAVHDLRGNVQSVSTAADVLGESDLNDEDRIEFARLIQQGVEVVSGMLGELMTLARLEAGLEQRQETSFDAAQLLRDLCLTSLPIAMARGLYLRTEGEGCLVVDGDPGKVRRLVQNLLLNALKYTVEGGVVVSWGVDKESWWVMVKDTGPGLMAGPREPMVADLKEATASARETDAPSPGSKPVIPLADGDPPATANGSDQTSGEGIGLSIVKRLCKLLDASVELASSPETGSTFRVVFPRTYTPGSSHRG